VICVGRLNKPKNYPFLVEALADLLRRKPEYRERLQVLIAGDGDQRDVIESLISKYELNEIFCLLGVRSDIPDLLSKSDIFVMSSSYEGLPISLLEAIGAGLPVLVTDVGGNGEVLQMTGAGMISSPSDVTGFSRALERLLSDESLRGQYSSAGLMAIERFSISSVAHDYMHVYHAVVGK
jgi:glycosyltransferase involved in cell wall biosynthesis